MAKRKAKRFEQDELVGEYEKPGPRTDPDGARIASALSEIKKRSKPTGWVVAWRPPWSCKAFSFYFIEDKLAVDFFNRDQPKDAELDALADDLTPEQRQEVADKGALCNKHGVRYMHLGPDDELDKVQLAARLGILSYKKGERKARNPEIAEEEANG